MSKNIFQKFSDALSDKKKQVIVAIPKNISYTIILGTSKRSLYAVKNGTKVGRLFDNMYRNSMQYEQDHNFTGYIYVDVHKYGIVKFYL